MIVTGAIVGTVFDAVLLQRKYDFFTGGFLSLNHLQGLADTVAFITVSLVADATVVGLLVGVVLWVSAYRRLRRGVQSLLALVPALSPIIIMNFFAYELLAYLGNAFDLSLMFELTGGNPWELLAVSFPQLLMVGSGLLGAAALVGCSLWMLHRYLPEAPHKAPLRPALGHVLLLCLVVSLIGLGVTSAACLSSEALNSGLQRKPSGRVLAQIVEYLSDFDRDGYGLLRRPVDPAPFDPRIFPYAVDIPGNGIDENRVGGDLPLDRVGYTEALLPAPQWHFKPHIVFIMLEGIRADTVGATYHGQRVTPVLEALAARGVSAQYAFSHNGFTVQSRHHVFSGSLANLRGRTTLIDDFKAHGYQVAYFSAQDESFGGPAMGIGFERADIAYDARVEPHRRFTTFSTPASLGLPFRVLQESIQRFLTSRTSTQPLFLYINFYDTHFPYHHAGIRPLINEIVLSRVKMRPHRAQDLQAMYLNTVANVDRAIGEVLEAVRRTLGGDPAVIVTSDHGENLFDDGFLGHGYVLNDAQTRIPLIVTDLPMVIEEPWGQADLRGALNAALASLPTRTPTPVLREKPEGWVFQYLGPFNQPRQIALAGKAGRTMYDFRTGLARVGQETWRHPDRLTPEESRIFLQLVHFWESMILARRAQGSAL